ncbi:MAG TPA: phytoene/squalene synthase family protein [Bryobacteraceae bacterium]|nr:phytoene/squalene synthase family protein [Bryobacteraceae bacterium]
MPATVELSDLDKLFREAAEQTARGSKSFYFATRFFPPELARAAHSVYWFCRYTDDLVDECSSLADGRRQLEAWERELEAAVDAKTAEHPVLRVFLYTARKYSIPLEYAFELIKGMRMDLHAVRYQNFDELQVFCYRVASVVGLMMCSLIGLTGAAKWEIARQHAIDLGIAMQLTNILRDVTEDLRRDRIYLPADEMAQFGYSEADLRAGRRNDAFRSLMRYQVARARTYYVAGNTGIGMLNSRGRFAVKVASDVYQHILGNIERSDFNVFERRAVVSPAQKYWLTMRCMAVPMARHSARKLAFWNT